MAAEHYRIREERLAALERVTEPEPQERRPTGEVLPMPERGNGVLRKWLFGLLAAAVVGAFGWMAAWGEQGAEVVGHERRITKIEERQIEEAKDASAVHAAQARETSAISARQEMLINSLNEMKQDIKTLLRRGRRR